MDLQLKGKRALVTGSTAGIGYAIVEALLREGASVIVNGRTPRRVNEAIQRLSPLGAALGLAADLATSAGAQAAVQQYPSLDILVNNVGIFEPKPFEAITDARLAPLLRNQRPQRGSSQPPLPAAHDYTGLGPRRVYIE